MGSRKGDRTGDYRTGARLVTWRGKKTTHPTPGPVRGPIEDEAGRRGQILTPSQSEGGAILTNPAPPGPVTKTS